MKQIESMLIMINEDHREEHKKASKSGYLTTHGKVFAGLAVCIFAGELSIARLICSGELNPEHI